MKKIFKIPFIAVLLIITLLFSSAGLPLLAEENKTEPVNSPSGQVSSKEEVIYCSLDNSGKLKNIYVVNILNVTIPGVVFFFWSF
jgi:biopolymer transport protein ExbD